MLTRRRDGIAARTVRLDGDVDPAALVVALRRPDEPWFLWERHGLSLAALGSVLRIEEEGPERFARAAARWRAVSAGTDLVAVGGFAFADHGGSSPQWSGFAPASLDVPEIAIARRGEDVWLTVAGPDLDAAEARVREAAARGPALPLLDPSPSTRTRVASVMPPEHFEEVVARATERIGRGEFEKIVLAREVAVHSGAPHDAAAVYGVLRGAFRDCFIFCVGRGDAAFVAASPELLVRRDGARAQTVALAGSIRRSADPAVDNHLGEQLLRSTKDRTEHEIVARRIASTLRRHALWVTSAEEPAIIKVANIQHLATPIRAQLREPIGALELAGLLHPTPAVGAEPAAAASLIPALEGLDRGWYAGAIGWTDAAEDGEFCVGLRCALLRGAEARCYAGVGVVGESNPAEELAETETKLGALLPVLAL